MHARVCVCACVHLCVLMRLCGVGGAGRAFNDQF